MKDRTKQFIRASQWTLYLGIVLGLLAVLAHQVDNRDAFWVLLLACFTAVTCAGILYSLTQKSTVQLHPDVLKPVHLSLTEYEQFKQLCANYNNTEAG